MRNWSACWRGCSLLRQLQLWMQMMSLMAIFEFSYFPNPIYISCHIDREAPLLASKVDMPIVQPHPILQQRSSLMRHLISQRKWTLHTSYSNNHTLRPLLNSVIIGICDVDCAIGSDINTPRMIELILTNTSIVGSGNLRSRNKSCWAIQLDINTAYNCSWSCTIIHP